MPRPRSTVSFSTELVEQVALAIRDDAHMNDSWMVDSACRAEEGEALLTDAFYPGVGENYGPAKDKCGECPVKTNCLTLATAFNETHGLWGGMSPRGRRKFRAAVVAYAHAHHFAIPHSSSSEAADDAVHEAA